MIGQVIAPDENGTEVVLATLRDDGAWETSNPLVVTLLNHPDFDDTLEAPAEFIAGETELIQLAELWGNGARVEMGKEPPPTQEQIFREESINRGEESS